MTIELAIAPVVAGRISTPAGVKVQDASSGRPEQESVTDIGAVSDVLFSGVIATATVPDWPGVRESEVGATET